MTHRHIDTFVFNQDARDSFSRFGANISTFAPGKNVSVMNFNGATVAVNGTSIAAPYMAGVFAAACQAGGTFCNTMATASAAYNALRSSAVLGSVVNADGTPLPSGTPSRFINRGTW